MRKDAWSSTEGITWNCVNVTSFNEWEQIRKEIKRKKWTFAWSNKYLNEWKYFRRQFCFRFDVFLCHFFLSAFLSSKQFRNNKIHCKTIDHYSIYFCWSTAEKRKLENCCLGGETWILVCLTFDLNLGVSNMKVIAFYGYSETCYLVWLTNKMFDCFISTRSYDYWSQGISNSHLSQTNSLPVVRIFLENLEFFKLMVDFKNWTGTRPMQF